MKIRSKVVEINPLVKVELGCGPKGIVEADSYSNLEVNIILIEDQFDGRLLLISIDTLYVGPKFMELIRSEFASEFTLEEIFIASSHTHNAPMIDETKPSLGITSQDYLLTTIKAVIDGIHQLLKQEALECKAREGTYLVSTSTYRRKTIPYQFTRKGLSIFPTLLLPNVAAELNPESNVLEFIDLNGNSLAMIWILPCHPVSYPRARAVSAHFIGDVRDKLRERVYSDRNYPLVFLQGASGDLRPPAITKSGFSPLRRALSPGMNNVFHDFSEREYLVWVNRVFEELVAGTKLLKSKSVLGDWRLAARLYREPLRNYFDGNVNNRFLEIHCLKLGKRNIIGISAEPTWKSVNWLRSGFKTTTVVGCLSDTFGYLPSFFQWIAGGYEKSKFMSFFGIKNRLIGLPGQLKALFYIREIAARSIHEMEEVKSL
jgi:hypothetical protein